MFIRRISEGTLSTVAAIELFLAAQLAGVSSGPFFVWLAARAGSQHSLLSGRPIMGHQKVCSQGKSWTSIKRSGLMLRFQAERRGYQPRR
jgi:hypothetical protein